MTGPWLALQSTTLLVYPPLLGSLLLFWAYHRFLHPWKSRGISVGFEPQDKWRKKGEGLTKNSIFLATNKLLGLPSLPGPTWWDHSDVNFPGKEE